MNCKKTKQAKALRNELKQLSSTISDMKGMIAKRNEEIIELKNGIKRATIRSIEIENELKELNKREEVMNTLNAHNPMLVKAINDLWNDDEHSKLLEIILRALYLRDMEEFQEKLSICPHSVMEDPLDYAHLYLAHVADDADLVAVLEFCRWNYE